MSRWAAEVILAHNGVRLMSKADSMIMRFLSVFLGKRFMTDFWTTYRLPFCAPVISYPARIKNPAWHTDVLRHEMVHVGQFKPWYGPVWIALLASLFPLPVLFSGRWYIERRAYLKDIEFKRRTLDECVDVLWSSYGWCWPKSLMRGWFLRELAKK